MSRSAAAEEVPPGGMELNPEAYRAVVDAVSDMLGGKVHVTAIHDPRSPGKIVLTYEDGTVAEVDGYALGRVIRVAMTQPGVTHRILNHEVIHALRNMGVFSEREWALLEKQAEREGWIEKYGIKKRYPDADPAVQLEEAIAEAFSYASQRPEAERGSLMRRLYRKVADFFRRLGNFLTNKGFKTVEDVFGDIQSGEIGRRKPGSGMPERGETSVIDSLIGAQAVDPNIRFAMPKPIEDVVRSAKTAAAHVAAMPKIAKAIQTTRHNMLDFVNIAQMMVSPMAARSASIEARALAKTNMSMKALNQWNAVEAIKAFDKEFTPEDARRMWEAADAESVALQMGEDPAAAGVGLITLSPRERAMVEQLQAAALEAFETARKLKMTAAEGLPSYVPRMVMEIGSGDATVVRDIRTLIIGTQKLNDAIADRILINQIRKVGMQTGSSTVHVGEPSGTPMKARSPKGAPGNPMNPFGETVSTTTPNLRRRKYLTVEETEAAANRIVREDGTVWFTIPENHSFYEHKPVGFDETGRPYTDNFGNVLTHRVPVYVRGDFEGPLRAIMFGPDGKIYRGLMDLKGRMMSAILYGVTHLGVIAGRMAPVAPNLVKLGTEGAAARRDPDVMQDLIMAGLRPIGHRGGYQDIMAQQATPELYAGRSWTAQLLGGAAAAIDPKTGLATKKGVDALGKLVHETLLWERVGDLQVGFALLKAEDARRRGASEASALKIGANMGNVFAGALPRESMSHIATVVANLALFSRSYRIAGAAFLKNNFLGLPRDTRAQIEMEEGPEAMRDAVKIAKSMNRAATGRDFLWWFTGLALLQSGANVLLGLPMDPEDREFAGEIAEELKGFRSEAWRRVKGEAHSYYRRAAYEAKRWKDAPVDQALRSANPLHAIMRLLPTSEQPRTEGEPGEGRAYREHGKTTRILFGYDEQGRAQYLRPVFGKAIEDIYDYTTEPVRRIGTVLSPYMTLPREIIFNERMPGRPLYDKTAAGVVQTYQLIRNGAVDQIRSMIPAQALDAALNLGDHMLHQLGVVDTPPVESAGRSLAKIILGGVGVTMSQGHPGGGEAARMLESRQGFDYAFAEARQDLVRLIRGGKEDEARERMAAMGMTPKDINSFVQRSSGPRRIGRMQIQRYNTRQEAVGAH